jgi:hypothetical protein
VRRAVDPDACARAGRYNFQKRLEILLSPDVPVEVITVPPPKTEAAA